LTYSKSDEVEFSSNVVVRATNIDLSTHKLDFSELRYISDSIQVKDDKRLKKNDILICTASGSKSHLGKVALVESDLGMAFGGFMGALRVNPNKITPQYLFIFMVSSEFKRHIESLSDGANINNLKFSQIEDLEIPIPPLATQRKIVAKLDAIFAEIDKATAAAEANAKNAEALFQSELTQVFDDTKFDYRITKFGEVATFVRGPFGGSLKKSYFVSSGYAVYEQQHAINNQFSEIRYFIDETKFHAMKRFELSPGDLIMSCSGTMGKIAIAPRNVAKGIINQALLKITPVKEVSATYLSRFLTSQNFQREINELSGGAAIQNVPAVSILKEIRIPVLDSSKQKVIVDLLDDFESHTKKIKKSNFDKISACSALKNSILKQAFAGE